MKVCSNKLSLLLLLPFVIGIASCGFMGNTIREYKSKFYYLDMHSMRIMQTKYLDVGAIDVTCMLIDSNSKQYKTELVKDKFSNFPVVYSLLNEADNFDSIRQNYSIFTLHTLRDKTWYTLELSPNDWKNPRKVYFTKNVW